MAVTLERMPVCVHKEPPEQTDAFAQEVEAKLKYGGLTHHQNQHGLHQRVLAALAGLNMAPLKPGLVARYKAQKVGLGWQRATWDGWCIGFVIAAIGAVIVGAVWAAAYFGDKSTTVFWPCYLPIGVIACCAVGFIWCAQPCYDWESRKLDEYGGQVPRFALQTAMEVQQAMQQQNIVHAFYVEELREQHRSRWLASVADPFLVLHITAGQDYYLEVWDEPSFDIDREI